MKKVLSLVLTMVMLLSVCCAVPVGAEVPADLQTDYVPTDDGNLITKWPTNANPNANSGSVSMSTSGNVTTVKATANITQSTAWGLNGYLITTQFMEALPTFSAGDKLLLGAKVKMASTSSTNSGKINVVYQRTQSTYIWPDNYPSDTEGFAVTGTEWQDFKTIATVANDTIYDDTYRYPVIGLSKGTSAGTAISLDMSTLFFGVEKAYDINVSSNDSTHFIGSLGGEIDVAAKIVNQFGDAYAAQGDFTWYALTDDRTAVAQGITVTPGADGTATVTVGSDAVAGTYDIVAASDTYEGFVKGISITVGGTLTDYVPDGDIGNLVTKYPTNDNPNGNSGSVQCTTSAPITTLTAKSDITSANPSWGLDGFLVNNPKFMDEAPSFAEGTKLIFKARVKNGPGTTNGKVNVSFARTASSSVLWPDNYPSSQECFTITGTDWVEFSASITAGKSFDSYRTAIFGMAAGTSEGDKVLVDLSSIVYAAEKKYDIKITTNDSTTIETGIGGTILADADIVNQAGVKGSLNQGDFRWFALNQDRSSYAEGITVTPGADGKATINVSPSTAEGTYVIVAQSTEDEEFIDSLDITVETKDWTDHTGITVDNWFDTPTMAVNYSGNVGGSVAVSLSSGEVGNILTTTSVIEQGTSDEERPMGVYIAGLADAAGTGTYPAGTQFIFSFRVRNLTPETPAKVNATFFNGGSLKSIFPDEYPSNAYDDCFTIEGSDWNTFRGIITASAGVSFKSYTADIGIPRGVPAGTAIEIDNSSIYVAPVTACDVKITDHSELATLDPGVASSYTADIVDQQGNPMGRTESFSWALLSLDRTQRITDVTFTPDAEDATTVAVVADKTVPEGEYYLVAESTANNETKGWKNSVLVNVLKPTIHDYVAGTIPGTIYDLVLTRTDAGDETMSLTDTASFDASIVNSSQSEVAGQQRFAWRIMDEARKETVTDEFTVSVADNTETATVTPKLTTKNGTYYVMAQYLDNEEIIKAKKIVIDKSVSVAESAGTLNNSTATEIEDELKDIATIVEVNNDLIEALDESTGAVKEKASAIIAESLGGENQLPANDMEAVKEMVEAAIVIALYNENPENKALFDEEGNFIYEEELGIDEMDTDGVTLYGVFTEVMSDEGRLAMQEALEKIPYTTVEGFNETLKESIILYGVQYPGEIGVSYLEEVLTEKNLEEAGISAPNYLAKTDKSTIHKEIARKQYTAETLAAALEKNYNEGGSSSTGTTTGGSIIGGGAGGAGGGGGGGYSAPIETSPDKKDDDKTTDTSYLKFTDVPESHWAYSDIYYLKERNIINGVDEKSFNPSGNITREQFAKILCSALEIDVSNEKTSFKDVDENAWYAPFVSAVLGKGIVNGMTAETFGVGENITRQDLCTMIYRALDGEKYSYTALGFTDDDDIAAYAKEAVALLKGLGIVNGYEDGSFNPNGICTRAEAAKIICKLMDTQEVGK